MKKYFTVFAAILCSSIIANEIKVPVRWERKNVVRDFQVSQAGFADTDGKYVVAAIIKNMPEFIRNGGNAAIYWNTDGDKNTGRFSGSLGVDLQMNISFSRNSVQLIRWQGDRKQNDIAASAEECRLVDKGDLWAVVLAQKILKEIKFAKNSEVSFSINTRSGRSDYVTLRTGVAAAKDKFINVPLGSVGVSAAPAAEGNISTAVIWQRRKASPAQVSQAGFYQDKDKYVFAFKVKDAAKITAGGFYWNSDGDKNSGRFPGSQGVDVQFNIDMRDKRINAVLWKDRSHRYMTIYEDDYLLEIVGDVLYFALRKQALNQYKINDRSDFVFQYNIGRKQADRIYCRIDAGAAGRNFIAPALKFIRFGALKSNRVKKSFAVPVARKNSRAVVWNCGGERFSPGEATPAFAPAIPALSIKAAKGETASIFFAVEAENVFKNLQIVPRQLSGKKSVIAAADQKVQYADYICDDRGELFTDVLFDKFHGKAGKRHFAVLHIAVPRNAEAGVYKGSMQLIVDGKADAGIPVEVTVYDFELPKFPAMRSAFSIKNGHIGVRFTDNKIRTNIYNTMIERGAAFRFGPRLAGVEPRFKLDSKGKLHIDWRAYDKRVDYLINTLGVNTIQLPPGQLGSHDKFIRWNSILKKNYKNTDDPEFQSVFRQYVRAYADHIKKLGIADKMLFVVWDEPYGLEEPLKGARIVRETAPEIPIGLFIDRYDPAATDIDIWLTTLQNVAKVIKSVKGKRVWLYNSNGVNNFKLPASDLRSFFYLADRHGMEGFLSSEINVIGKSGCKNGVYYNHYPQHCLFYVSNDGKEVYDSWRLVLLRQGFNDFDYLNIYKKLLKSKGKAVPQWLIDAEPDFDAQGMPDFKIDTMAELDKLRDRIAGEIVKLKQK